MNGAILNRLVAVMRAKLQHGAVGGCALALIPLLFANSIQTAAQEQPKGQEPRVLVWRQVRNDFHNSSLSDEFIAQIVEKTPARRITIDGGDDISTQLQRTYNVSETWTPSIYRQMLSRISELNSILDVNKVQAGTTLLVPDIPKTGKYYKKLPSGWLGQNIKTALSWTGDAVRGTATTTAAPAGAAPQIEIQYFSVPLSEVGKYLLDNHERQGASGPLPVVLAQDGTGAGTATDSVLTAPAANAIQSMLAKAQAEQPNPVVLIVDDSIPDNDEYAKAKNFILEVSKVIRDTYKLGDSPYVPELQALPDSLAAEDPATLYPNLRTHASLIKRSLDEFTKLDSANRVSVVYVPLAATQIGVAPMLKELLYLAQILKTVQPKLPPAITASKSQREQAESETEVIVKGNASTFHASLPPLVSGEELRLTTDRMLIEALSIVMSYYSDAARRPHALSFSWTTPQLAIPVYIESNCYGWKFAAAGNQGTKPAQKANFLEQRLQFASRAAAPKDFVAVMNSTGSAGGCPSNVFDDSGIQVVSVAYPGNATSTFCGTSFSTPRVAWLIAAKEAAVGKRLAFPVKEHAKIAWLDQQRSAILSLRQGAASGVLQRYSLDAQNYFSH